MDERRSGRYRRTRPRSSARAAGAATVALIAAALMPATASATTSVVTFYAASGGTANGVCSAVEPCALGPAGQSGTALNEASAEPNTVAVTIDLAAGTYTGKVGDSCGSGAQEMDLYTIGSEGSLTLDGAGSSASILTGCGTVEVMYLRETYPVELENLELTDGYNDSNSGGDLGIDSGTVTLSDVTITGGQATNGSGDGGDIEIAGAGDAATVTIENSVISDGAVTTNTSGDGGGIMVYSSGTLTLEDSALEGNTADGGGAGIYSEGALDAYDSTFVVSHFSAALEVAGGGTGNVYGATFFQNYAGVVADSATINLGGSLLYENGTDCANSSGTFNDEGYNYAGGAIDTSCNSILTASTSRHGVTLTFGDFGANGGPTPTLPLTSSSAAGYDVVPTGTTLSGDPRGEAFCSQTDQRGVPRTQGPTSACSAGAFQYAPPVVTSVSPRSSLELGLPITLSGYSLGNVRSATFGGAAATITSESADSISLDVPSSLGLGSQPITLTNVDGSATVAFSAVASPSIATSTLAPGELKVPYSQSIAVAGGAAPFTYALQSGALPAGLSLSSSGVVSGTPTRAGGSAFAVQVTDANGIASSTVNVSLVIATPVVSLGLESRLTVTDGSIAVTVACDAAPCVGQVSLTESVTVKLKHHKTKVESVALASAPYSLSAGQSGAVELTLTATGDHVLSRHALKKAKKHPLHETLQATAAGATTATTTVSVT